MVIPYQKLQHETLLNLIKEFVMREGTDYTHNDYSIEMKIESNKQKYPVEKSRGSSKKYNKLE